MSLRPLFFQNTTLSTHAEVQKLANVYPHRFAAAANLFITIKKLLTECCRKRIGLLVLQEEQAYTRAVKSCYPSARLITDAWEERREYKCHTDCGCRAAGGGGGGVGSDGEID